MDVAPLVLTLIAILATIGALAATNGVDSRDDFADPYDHPRSAL
jgi:hypothetical protein